MDDETLKDEDDELDVKLPPEIEKSGDVLDEEPESVEELAEEEEEVVDDDKFDDENPI